MIKSRSVAIALPKISKEENSIKTTVSNSKTKSQN
jgi:hypothetical protein